MREESQLEEFQTAKVYCANCLYCKTRAVAYIEMGESAPFIRELRKSLDNALESDKEHE